MLATAKARERPGRAATLEIGGKTVIVASLDDIVRSKEIANRPPDQEALPELRELQEQVHPEDDLWDDRGI